MRYSKYNVLTTSELMVNKDVLELVSNNDVAAALLYRMEQLLDKIAELEDEIDDLGQWRYD